MELIFEYDFFNNYIKGKENKVVDALNHRNHIETLILGHIDHIDRIYQLQAQYYQYK